MNHNDPEYSESASEQNVLYDIRRNTLGYYTIVANVVLYQSLCNDDDCVHKWDYFGGNFKM